jgi:hypothetical protein
MEFLKNNSSNIVSGVIASVIFAFVIWAITKAYKMFRGSFKTSPTQCTSKRDAGTPRTTRGRIPSA